VCIKDFEEMKAAHSVYRVFPYTTTAQKCVVYSPNRVALIFSCSSGNGFLLGKDALPTSTEGVLINTIVGSMIFTTAQHGDLPTREWFVIGAAGTGNVAIIEVFSPGSV